MSPTLRRVARVLFVVAGVAFLVVALVRAVQDPDLSGTPSLPASAGAVVLIVLALFASALAWSRLLDRPATPRLVRGFMLAQLGKYLPGGVWQAVGQVRDAVDVTSVSGTGATIALVASVVVQAAAGAVVGTTIALAPDVPLWVRLSATAAGAAAVAVLVAPRWLGAAVRRVGPLHRRVDLAELPTRGQLLSAWRWTLPSMVVIGAVFVIALHGVSGDVVPAALPAFAIAWTVGFLAVPFPAGLGVREAVLVALLPGRSITELVAAAAIVRILAILAELLAGAASMLLSRPRATSTASGEDVPDRE